MFIDLPIAIGKLVISSLLHPASPFFYGVIGSILATPWLPSFYMPVASAATLLAIFAHNKLTGEKFKKTIHDYFVKGQIDKRVNFISNAPFAFPTLEVLYKTCINPGIFVTYNHVIKNFQELINFGSQTINKPEQILPLNIESLLNSIGNLAVGTWNNIGDLLFKLFLELSFIILIL